MKPGATDSLPVLRLPVIRRSKWPNGAHVGLWVIPVSRSSRSTKKPSDSGSAGIPVPDVPTSSTTGREIASQDRAQPGRHEAKNHVFVEHAGIQSVDLR